MEQHSASFDYPPPAAVQDRLANNAKEQNAFLLEQQEVAALLVYLEQILHPAGQYSNDVFYLRSIDNKQLLYVSPNYERIWGLTRASVYQEPCSWLRAVHPKDIARVKQSLLTPDKYPSMELLFRIIKPGGFVRWIRARSIPILDSQGKAQQVLGICCDVTRQRQHHRRRSYLQRQYHALLALAEALIVNEGQPDALWERVAHAIQKGLGATGVEIALYQDNCWQWAIGLGPSSSQGLGRTPVEAYGAMIAQASCCEQPLLWRAPFGQGERRIGLLQLLRDSKGQVLGFCAAFGQRPLPYPVLASRFLSNAATLLERWLHLGQLQHKLANTEAILTQFAETIDDALYVTDDAHATVDYVNAASQNIWQQSCEHLKANPSSWLDVVHPQDKARITQQLLDAESRRNWRGNYRIVRPDGSVRHILDRTFPVYVANHYTGRVVGVARDVTLEHELNERNLALAKADAAIAARTEVLAYVSHDLRSPLSSLLLHTRLLARYLQSNDVPQALAKTEQIEQIALRMGHVLNHLNDMVQLEAGANLQQVQHPYAPAIPIKQLLQDYQSHADEQQVLLQAELDEQLFCAAVDKFHLLRIVENLLSNSVKHTPPKGQIKVRLYAHAARLYVEVADTGPGIGGAILGEIATPFWRKHASLRRGGVGMGLSIVYGLVQRYRGTFAVTAQAPYRTIVTIGLPLTVLSQAEASP